MGLTIETESVARRISELYSTLKGTDTQSNIVRKINDIIIYGDKISTQALVLGWNYYAYKKGATKTLGEELQN